MTAAGVRALQSTPLFDRVSGSSLFILLGLALLVITTAAEAGAPEPAGALARVFAQQVDRGLNVPQTEQTFYGEALQEGCIRIPAQLNAFIDRYGLLDADYEEVVRLGGRLWVLRSDRQPMQWPGRYLVIVDSMRRSRPAWTSR